MVYDAEIIQKPECRWPFWSCHQALQCCGACKSYFEMQQTTQILCWDTVVGNSVEKPILAALSGVENCIKSEKTVFLYKMGSNLLNKKDVVCGA